MTVRVASLCTGVGGLDMGVHAAFAGRTETVWYAENDDDAKEVLAVRLPGVRNIGDLTLADWSTLPPVEVIVAGVPCQPVSAAGPQEADLDPRWLWPHVRDAIGVLRPREVILENVRNLIRIRNGRLFAGILADLAAAGYAVRWATVGACAVGACHHRHRVFVVARDTHRPTGPPAVRVPMLECGARRGRPRLLLDGTTTDAQVLLPTPTVADGMGGPGSSGRDGGDNLRTAVCAMPDPPHGTCDTGPVAIADRYGVYGPAAALWQTTSGIAAPPPTRLNPSGQWRLDARLTEWMMGLPTGWITDLTAGSPAVCRAGNAVVPQVVAAAYPILTAGWAYPQGGTECPQDLSDPTGPTGARPAPPAGGHRPDGGTAAARPRPTAAADPLVAV